MKASVNLHIATRFIYSKKRAVFLSIIGIVFGVTSFILTLAQITGFESFFIKTLTSFEAPLEVRGELKKLHRKDSHLMSVKVNSESNPFVVATESHMKHNANIDFPLNLKKELLNFSEINAVAEFINGRSAISSSYGEMPVEVYGIFIEDYSKVVNLKSKLIAGDISSESLKSNEIIIGSRIANKLKIEIGNRVNLFNHMCSEKYEVVAIFDSGIGNIDESRVFMNLTEARSFLSLPFGNVKMKVDIKDIFAADKLSSHIQMSLNHYAIDWKRKEKSWLEAFRVLKISGAITVFSILIISGLGMFNTLAILVFEKEKEIAILRSMGFSRSDIKKIFFWLAGIILSISLGCAWFFSALATFGISTIPVRIRGIFSTNTMVVNWNLNHYLLGTFLAIVVVFLAAYLPARKAAKILPANIIRGNST